MCGTAERRFTFRLWPMGGYTKRQGALYRCALLWLLHLGTALDSPTPVGASGVLASRTPARCPPRQATLGQFGPGVALGEGAT